MGKNKFIYLLILAAFSGMLFLLSWPPNRLTYLIFIAFVPLLYIEDELNKNRVKHSNLKLFILSFFAFLIWSFATSWWLSKASIAGGSIAVFGNAILMSFPILLYHQIKNHVSSKVSYIALISFWISLEYLHLNWDLAWPWLNLGNIFAVKPGWIQWYEFTGTIGGTVWVWLVNIAIYTLTKYLLRFDKGVISSIKIYNRVAFFLLTLFIPLIISFIIKPDNGKITNKNAVIVQPNIDPYNEKFREGGFSGQLAKMIHLSDSLTDSNTMVIVWPETAISVEMDESILNSEPVIHYIREFLSKHPDVKIISGMSSYKFFGKDEKLTSTARKYVDKYYDSYNSALMIDTTSRMEIYHKSKLVPGVEKMPYPKIFKFLEKLTINLGGASGSLGAQDEASVFKFNDSFIFAPVICYESVFGEYLGDYVQKGANVMVVITNDGWWGNSIGYKQHLNYSVLRAIELRKFIIRSANTGISCFVDPSGEIFQPTEFWVPTAIKQNIQINNQNTFYAKNGDYIARIGLFAAILFILVWIPKLISEKYSKKR